MKQELDEGLLKGSKYPCRESRIRLLLQLMNAGHIQIRVNITLLKRKNIIKICSSDLFVDVDYLW